ncbi:MAG TPA: flagellar basal body P-ring formation chaperone FlgA [Terriglobales bacterium]|nr:flagellar basal body P-ring formation chaperone FlgA [Terriglobales bacterium]
MRSSVSLLVLALAAPAVAAEPPDAARVAPHAERIAEGLARAWSVPASRIRLAWGRLPATLPPADAPLRIAGTAPDGWSVVVIGEGAAGRALRVRAGLEDSVPVVTRALATGAVVSPGDLRLEARVRWGPPAARLDAPGAGWIARRPLAAGEELTRRVAGPPPLVRAGEPVRVIWAGGGVRIRMEGIALNSAREGETVRARVPGRSGALAGIATAAGEIALGKEGSR